MCLVPTALQGCVRYTLPSLQTSCSLSLQQAGEITISEEGTPRLSSLAWPQRWLYHHTSPRQACGRPWEDAGKQTVMYCQPCHPEISTAPVQP